MHLIDKRLYFFGDWFELGGNQFRAQNYHGACDPGLELWGENETIARTVVLVIHFRESVHV